MKKKIMRIIIIVLIILAVAVAAVPVYRHMKAKKHAPLISYSDSYGGDMNGSHHVKTIKKIDDEKALVTTSDADWYDQDPITAEYYVPLSVITEIEKIYDTYGMYTYDNLPDNPIQVLDGGTSSYSFVYEDQESVSFSDYELIPAKGYEGLRKIDNILNEAIKSGEKLPGPVEEHPENE